MHVNLGNEEQDGTKQDFNPLQWNQSNPTHQGNREICPIVQDVGILRILATIYI
jgi:hypothetical protein